MMGRQRGTAAPRSLEAAIGGGVDQEIAAAATLALNGHGGLGAPGADWLFAEKGYGLGLMLDRTSRYGVLAGHSGDGPGYSLGVLTGEVGGGIVTAAALANTDGRELGMRIAAAMLEACWTG